MQRFSGASLRTARESAGLSREQVAVAIGRSAASVQLYELGNVVPPGTVLERLSAALRSPVGEWFRDELMAAA